MIGSIIGWIVAGLIVGALARLVVPGRQSMGIGMTIVLGIVGAMVGGFIYHLIWSQPMTLDNNGFAVETAWPGWIIAVIGGALVLWIFLAATGTRSVTRSDRLP